MPSAFCCHVITVPFILIIDDVFTAVRLEKLAFVLRSVASKCPIHLFRLQFFLLPPKTRPRTTLQLKICIWQNIFPAAAEQPLSGAFLLHHLPVSTMGGGCWKKGYWNYQSGRTVTLSSASSLSSAVLLVPPPSAWLASLLMRLFCLPEKHMLGSYLLKRFLTFCFAPPQYTSFHHSINQVLQLAILS